MYNGHCFNKFYTEIHFSFLFLHALYNAYILGTWYKVLAGLIGPFSFGKEHKITK